MTRLKMPEQTSDGDYDHSVEDLQSRVEDCHISTRSVSQRTEKEFVRDFSNLTIGQSVKVQTSIAETKKDGNNNAENIEKTENKLNDRHSTEKCATAEKAESETVGDDVRKKDKDRDKEEEEKEENVQDNEETETDNKTEKKSMVQLDFVSESEDEESEDNEKEDSEEVKKVISRGPSHGVPSNYQYAENAVIQSSYMRQMQMPMPANFPDHSQYHQLADNQMGNLCAKRRNDCIEGMYHEAPKFVRPPTTCDPRPPTCDQPNNLNISNSKTMVIQKQMSGGTVYSPDQLTGQSAPSIHYTDGSHSFQRENSLNLGMLDSMNIPVDSDKCFNIDEILLDNNNTGAQVSSQQFTLEQCSGTLANQELEQNFQQQQTQQHFMPQHQQPAHSNLGGNSVFLQSPLSQQTVISNPEDFGYDSDRSPLGQDIPVASPDSMGHSPHHHLGQSPAYSQSHSPPFSQTNSPPYTHINSPQYSQTNSPPYSQTSSPASIHPASPLYLAQSPPKTPTSGHNFAPPCMNYSPPPSNESADSGFNDECNKYIDNHKEEFNNALEYIKVDVEKMMLANAKKKLENSCQQRPADSSYKQINIAPTPTPPCTTPLTSHPANPIPVQSRPQIPAQMQFGEKNSVYPAAVTNQSGIPAAPYRFNGGQTAGSPSMSNQRLSNTMVNFDPSSQRLGANHHVNANSNQILANRNHHQQFAGQVNGANIGVANRQPTLPVNLPVNPTTVSVNPTTVSVNPANVPVNSVMNPAMLANRTPITMVQQPGTLMITTTGTQPVNSATSSPVAKNGKLPIPRYHNNQSRPGGQGSYVMLVPQQQPQTPRQTTRPNRPILPRPTEDQRDQRPETSPNANRSNGMSLSEKHLNLGRRVVAEMTREDILQVDDDGDTNLHRSMESDEYMKYMVQAILERMKREDLLPRIDMQNNRGQTPLYLAVASNNPAIVKCLLEYDAKTSLFAHRETSSNTLEKYAAIHCAASFGKPFLDTLKNLLMAKDIDVNLVNSNGYTALMCAIFAHGQPSKYGQIDSIPIIKALIDANADPIKEISSTNGKTALRCVLETGNLDLIEKTFQMIDAAKLSKYLKTAVCQKIYQDLLPKLDTHGQQRLQQAFRPPARGNSRTTPTPPSLLLQ